MQQYLNHALVPMCAVFSPTSSMILCPYVPYAAAAGYDPSELLCGQCSALSSGTNCPKHGTKYTEWKCRCGNAGRGWVGLNAGPCTQEAGVLGGMGEGREEQGTDCGGGHGFK